MVERRVLLSAGVAGLAGLTALGVTMPFTFPEASLKAIATPGNGPYGDPGPPNADGLQLPKGFTGRVVARSGAAVGGAGYVWHGAPDGGACFTDRDGGWVYVSNSELDDGAGGAGMLRFDRTGTIVGAARILGGTNHNCAGGATPWGTWLSCEEVDHGFDGTTEGGGVTYEVTGPFRA